MLWLTLALACTDRSQPDDSPDDSRVDDSQTADTQSSPDSEFCEPEELIAQVNVSLDGSTNAYFSAVVYDKSNPWMGAPAAQSEACGYYLYQPQFCEGCTTKQVCSSEGECVEKRRTLKDVTVTVTADSTEYSFQANEQGQLWGPLGAESSFAFDLQWPGGHVVSEALPLQDPITATVTSQGSYEQPGELQVSWSGATEGQVQTLIPINHHASSPTFTQCQAQASAGGFVVPAEMVDPLSVITGLEFQGLSSGEFAAAQTEAGCVQLSVTRHSYADVQFE